LRQPRLLLRAIPSTEAHARAAVLGWGIGVMPEQMAAPWLASAELQPIHPEVYVDVQLHWHQWKLRADDMPEPSLRAGTLDRIGRALAEGAQRHLRPAPG